MKILEINKFFYRRGGSETYLFALRELLKSHGHEVMDFSMNDHRNEVSAYQKYFINPIDFAESHGIFDKIYKAFRLLWSFEAAKKLDLLIKEKGRPDIAHLHNFSYHLTPSIIRVLKKHKIPIVWTLHDYKVVAPNYNLFNRGRIDLSTKPDKYFKCVTGRCVQNSYSKSFLAALEMFIHKKITKLYDKVDMYISPSKFLADLVVDWGIPKEKVGHIYNFLDLDKFEKYYQSRKLNSEFGFFSRLVEEKGLLLLIQAFAGLPQFKLKIYGEGPLQEQILDMIEHFNCSNVELPGKLSGDELYQKIADSKAIIMPSIWLENNPMIGLEAMILGVPIVGSDAGGIPELIDSEKTGIIYAHQSLDALRAAIIKIDQLDRVQLGEAARAKVKEIGDKEVHYGKLMEVLEEVTRKQEIKKTKNQ